MMRQITRKVAPLALLAATTFTLPGCSKKDASHDGGEALLRSGDQTFVRGETPDGGALVNTIKATATVKAINPAKREVTLALADGKRTTVKCGPDVVNFDQIEVNDKVNVTMTEELAIFLTRGEPAEAGRAAAVALAPVGAKPAGQAAEGVQITAKVKAIDAKTRMVTLTLSDGSTQQLKAGPKVDLSSVKPGDDVTARYTQAIAVSVEKP